MSFREDIMLGSLLIFVLTYGASKCVPNCHSDAEESCNDRRKEVAKFVFPFVISFQHSLTNLSLTFVQGSNGTTYKEGLSHWLLAVLQAGAWLQVLYGRAFGASTLNNTGSHE